MKTFIELELHYWDPKYLHRMYGYEGLPGTGKVFKQISSSWVAEITGTTLRGGVTRRFLESKRDYSRADNKGFKGIYAEFILESGRFYEVKNYKDRYFCRVDEDCNIIKISEAEVIGCLRNRSASMS